jgi:hypothetical protein
MNKHGLAAAGLLVIGYLLACLIFTDLPNPEKLIGFSLFEHRHHGGGAPAPLLAAGIPAFVALGGGAAITRLVRRFRKRTP